MQAEDEESHQSWVRVIKAEIEHLLSASQVRRKMASDEYDWVVAWIATLTEGILVTSIHASRMIGREVPYKSHSALLSPCVAKCKVPAS